MSSGQQPLGTPVAASVDAAHGNAGVPELAQASASSDESIAQLAAAGEPTMQESTSSSASSPSDRDSISAAAERMNATLSNSFPSTVNNGQSYCPLPAGAGSDADEDEDEEDWDEDEDESPAASAAKKAPAKAASSSRFFGSDSSDDEEEDDDEEDHVANSSDEEAANIASSGIVFSSKMALQDKPTRKYDEAFVAAWHAFPLRAGDFVLLGVHETPASNAVDLLQQGPSVKKIGTGHGLGKGSGFYVTPARPGQNLKKVLAVPYDESFVAVYVHHSVALHHGSALEIVVPDDQFANVRVFARPGAAIAFATTPAARAAPASSAASNSSSALGGGTVFATSSHDNVNDVSAASAASSSSSGHGGGSTLTTSISDEVDDDAAPSANIATDSKSSK